MSVNQEVKGQLAKLLATENLIIEHKKVPTASFDVLRRVLTLPIWNRASGVVYDLLVGHEVGHAIYTPNEDWTDKIPGVPKDYVNIVEDARIEKLMKRKFPGLARTFYNGYNELNEDDFFCIADDDVNKMILIDRINLHFKIGAYAQIPFNEKELYFVDLIEKAETFDNVLSICKELHQYTKEQAKDSMEVSSEESEQGSGFGEQVEVSSSSQISGDGSQTTQSSGSMPTDQQEESLESNDISQSGETPSYKNEGGGPNTEGSSEEKSKTQQAFDEKTKELSNSYASETFYVERPKLEMEHVVVDNAVLNSYINDYYKHQGDSFQRVDADYQKYKTESQKEVNYLVKEFEMKKSADAYQRMSTSRTGVLDCSKLHTYKYNEDIFRKVSVIPDGKNHGLVFVLDWSGSMCDYFLDTVKQLLNLVWFCKKVQIPFEVYAFTYEWSNSYVDSEYVRPRSISEQSEGMIEIHPNFSMMNILSSRGNSKALDQSILNLWRLACRMDRCYHGAHYSIPAGLDLSGTPLNESIISLHQIIPEFKNRNKLQKVNVVILTDGEGAHLNYHVNLKNRYGGDYSYLGRNYLSHVNALRDRKIGYVYRNFDSYCDKTVTAILLENLKDNFPEVNLIGFRILTGNSFSYLYRDFFRSFSDSKTPEDAMKVWRKEKSYEICGMGYDALYAISSTNLSTDTTMTVNEDATTADIGKAFRTMLKKKTTNKKLLSSFATLVS